MSESKEILTDRNYLRMQSTRRLILLVRESNNATGLEQELAYRLATGQTNQRGWSNV